MNNFPPTLTLREFFQVAKVSKAHFYNLPKEKRPRIVTVGSKMLITAQDAEAWFERLQREGSL